MGNRGFMLVVRVTLGQVSHKWSWVKCLMYIISMNSPSKRYLNKYMHRDTKKWSHQPKYLQQVSLSPGIYWCLSVFSYFLF